MSQRYERLGLSIGVGNRLKEQLLHQDWLEDQVVELGNTRKLLLRLTKQARDALGLGNDVPEHGSLVHSFWQRYWGQRFREHGYIIDFEVSRQSSGRVDVVAQQDGRKIAVEIETGKSDFLWNIRQNLAAKYDRIIVVATDKTAFEKIEKMLAQESLLIPGRVELVLKERFTLPI